MAYLIECDRCGETAKIQSPDDFPNYWLSFGDLHKGENKAAATARIEGGAFCRACVDDLAKWRKPIPRAMPDRAA